MAKFNHSVLGRVSGNLNGTTHVNSKLYGQHVRAKRGTHKPALLNDVLAANKENQASINRMAALIFTPIRIVHKDSTLWSRLLRIFRKQLKDGVAPHVHDLKKLQCSQYHTFDKRVPGGYAVQVHASAAALNITAVLLHQPDYTSSKNYIKNYQLSILVLFPDFVNMECHTEKVFGPVTGMQDALEPLQVTIAIPTGATQYVVFLGIAGCEGSEPVNLEFAKGTMVVATGDLETRAIEKNDVDPDVFAW